MKTVTLPEATLVPALGLGTWMMGEDRRRRQDEIAALRTGVELGLTLIDTAEMYGGDGAAEQLVREALGDVRDGLFLVGKAYPRMRRGPGWNARAMRASRGSASTGLTSICCTGAGACRSPRPSRRWSGWSQPARSCAGGKQPRYRRHGGVDRDRRRGLCD
jgi:hypothetical protein